MLPLPSAQWMLGCALLWASAGVAHAETEVTAEIDLLEVRLGDGNEHITMESTFTLGGERDRFVLKVDGGSDKRIMFDRFQVQALYARDVAPGITVLAGLRQDAGDGGDRTFAAMGIETAPKSGIEAEIYAFLAQDGDLTGNATLKVSLPLSDRLALEPRATLGWSAQDVPAQGVAAGPTDIECAVRLRLAIGERADLYVGFVHNRLIGDTLALARGSGDELHETHIVAGMGLRF